MAKHINSRIVTEGLVAYWDAANPKSYPGTGNKWYDLTSNGHVFNMSGTLPVVNGAMTFNGVDQYAECSTLNLLTGTSTIMCASRLAPGYTINGRVVNARNNNWLLGHHGIYASAYYAAGWVNTVYLLSDSNWRIYAGTADVTGDLYSFYINGKPSVLNSTGGTGGPNGLFIGRYSGATSEWSQCECGFIMAYNRVLTSEEIKQNFISLKSRYGL
jgi:hypothetical protein